ncbi:MAG: TIR domain-containing protein [Flammeovirgaceae bacterium]
MRTKVFISHATPDDNDFTRWLSLKLIGLGYEVWCDIFFLDKGVDFWSNIEKEIRENT